MKDDFIADEICVVCKKDARGSSGYCHIYQETGRVTLCCPACAEKFLRGPAHGDRGAERYDLIEELVEGMQWTTCGY
jgi:hypothetical protein